MSERTVATDTIRSPAGRRSSITRPNTRERIRKAHWVTMSHSESVVGWPLTSGGAPVGFCSWPGVTSSSSTPPAVPHLGGRQHGEPGTGAREGLRRRTRPRGCCTPPCCPPVRSTAGMDAWVTYGRPTSSRVWAGTGTTSCRAGIGPSWPSATWSATGCRPWRIWLSCAVRGGPSRTRVCRPRLLAELSGFTRHASQGKFATMAVAIVDPGAVC